jgi:hypothetical protein
VLWSSPATKTFSTSSTSWTALSSTVARSTSLTRARGVVGVAAAPGPEPVPGPDLGPDRALSGRAPGPAPAPARGLAAGNAPSQDPGNVRPAAPTQTRKKRDHSATLDPGRVFYTNALGIGPGFYSKWITLVRALPFLVGSLQCFGSGSGSGLDPDSIRSMDPYPDP